VKSRAGRVLAVVVAIVALVLLLALRPLSTSRALAIWTLLLAALALLEVAHAARTETKPGRFETALRRKPARPQEPVLLKRARRQLELGIGSAEYAHRRLLPVLRAAAAAKLASRHGVELVRQPERARELLGDETWSLLRPDRPAPADRHARGIPRASVATAIERVEAL